MKTTTSCTHRWLKMTEWEFSKDVIQGNGSQKKRGEMLWVMEMFERLFEQMSIPVSPSTYLAYCYFSYCCEWVILVKLPLWSLVVGDQFGLPMKVWWKLIFQEKHGNNDSGLCSLLDVAHRWLCPQFCHPTLGLTSVLFVLKCFF